MALKTAYISIISIDFTLIFQDILNNHITLTNLTLKINLSMLELQSIIIFFSRLVTFCRLTADLLNAKRNILDLNKLCDRACLSSRWG